MSPADRNRAARILALAKKLAHERIMALSLMRYAESVPYGEDRITAWCAHKARLKVVREAARDLLEAADIALITEENEVPKGAGHSSIWGLHLGAIQGRNS